jgi:hypothetical protein
MNNVWLTLANPEYTPGFDYRRAITPIQIQEGHWYRDIKGRQYGPMELNRMATCKCCAWHAWQCVKTGLKFSNSGQWHPDKPTPPDLIAECWPVKDHQISSAESPEKGDRPAGATVCGNMFRVEFHSGWRTLTCTKPSSHNGYCCCCGFQWDADSVIRKESDIPRSQQPLAGAREWWLQVHGNYGVSIHSTEKSAVDGVLHGNANQVIHVREVLPGDEVTQLRQQLAAKDAEIAELKKDKARLDWLEERTGGLRICTDKDYGWQVSNYFSIHAQETLRSAIDAAMKGKTS